MRRISVLLAWLLLVPATAQAQSDTINDVLGDASWTATRGGAPSSDERLRIRTHLTFVLDRLRTRDVTPLPSTQQQRRRRALATLEAYIDRGAFPRRTGDAYPGRRPRFIDDLGTHCAVAHLIAASGAPELARAINAEHEYAFVREITAPELFAWAAATGFTVEELAMIQPSYEGAPTPDGMRRELERAKDRIALACERQHQPVPKLAIHVRGDPSGRATVTSKSSDPFARCYVAAANKIEDGGGAYDTPPQPYAFDMVLSLTRAQQQLERVLASAEPDCLPRPGAIPRRATFEVSSSEHAFDVRVTTSPENAEATACMEAYLRDRIRMFGTGAWQLHAVTQRQLRPRLDSRRLRKSLHGHVFRFATDCEPKLDPPSHVKVTASANRDDAQFTIVVQSGNEIVDACVRDKLQYALRASFSVWRPRQEGNARYFRIDADVQASVTVKVETAAARAKRHRRMKRRMKQELDRRKYEF